MKKIFLLISFLAAFFVSNAQYPVVQFLGRDSALVDSRGGLKARLINYAFTDTAQANTQRISQYPGALIYTTSGGDKLWLRSADATLWTRVGTTGGGGSGIVSLGTSAYGLTIQNDSTYKADTIQLSTRLWRQKGIDSVQGNVSLKLNISDTANMRARLYAGSNVTITGTYPNLTIASTGGGSSDSSIFLVDTTYTRLAKAFGTDTLLLKSLRMQLNGVDITPTATDSTLSWNILASGSGTNNANAGSGFRLLKPTSQEIKTIFAGLYTTIDSSSNTDGLTIKADTATMFPAIRATIPGASGLAGSGTALQVALWTGGATLAGRDYYTWADNGNYPQLKIGNGATTTYGASLGLRDVTGSYGYLSIDGGTLALYGSNTYKSVGIYDSSGGQQIARFYTGAGNRKYIDFTGETVYSGVVSPNATRGIVGVNRIFVYTPTGNSARAFSDETEFRIGNAAYGSFISNIRFGNNGIDQDHAIGAQSHWVKDSTNRMRKVYGFANSVSEMRAGAITDFYGYYHYSPTIYGGTIDNQYGIYIPEVTGATRNLAAYFGDSIQIQDGSQGVGKVLTSDANGLATWATPSGSAADSATFATNYRVDSAKTNLRTSINTKLNISDTANKWVTAVYRKTASDSVFYIKGGTHTFAYKDSTGGGGGSPSLTSTYVGFGDGSNLLTGSSRMTFNNDANYPTLTIDGTYEGYLYLSTAVAADNFRISGAGGGTLYGSDTYKSVAINDHIYGGQVARFYSSGGTKYTDINGLTSFTSTVAPNQFQGAAHIVRTVPYSASGNSYNGYTDKTDFRVGASDNVSFATFAQIGNNRTNQTAFTSFRSMPTKDSSNTVGKMYDFLADNWSMKAGTVDTAYRIKVRDINKTGGTLSVQYGLYIDSLSAASANYNFLGNRLGIGVKAPTEMLDVLGSGKFSGTLTTGDPGSGAGAWKLGTVHSDTGLYIDPTAYIEISIGGTTYWLALAAPPFPTPKPKPQP